jgi:uncharacterized protein GlcG (DUF336 family)
LGRNNFLVLGLLSLLLACGGGGGGGSESANSADSAPDKSCTDQCFNLTKNDVEKVLAQGIAQAKALTSPATFAVVDRVGNVLAVYRMAAVDTAVTISSTFPVTVTEGLEGIVLPSGADGDALAAIAKAITGAYLSTEGNAFSTRTAGQIIQENFNPGEENQPAGPLFGVQFSQLACSDFTQSYNNSGPSVGPQRSPLGLSADSGGFPLYKNGVVVGGVGVMSDQRYSFDKNLQDEDADDDEIIALAATASYAAPIDRRADRITVDGKTLRFSDIAFDDLSRDPQTAPAFSSLTSIDGNLVAVNGYSSAVINTGTEFGLAESGIRADTLDYPDLDAFVFVDNNGVERYRPIGGGDSAVLAGAALSATEVRQILRSALSIANRARAQIRRPLGSQARVTISVVDSQGTPLGIVRTRDAPIFGSDVSLQKARTATLFSSTDASVYLNSITTDVTYVDANLNPKATIQIPDYVTALQSFVGVNALSDGIAFSDRAGGNLSRPFYPDGIAANNNGPLSKSIRLNRWSVFSTGLQLDLVFNNIVQHVLFAAAGAGSDVGDNCVQSSQPRLANGIQIFPGSVPIYRGSELIGGIGVSGDGVDQDDMISFLGVHDAGVALNNAIGNAPVGIRADNLTPKGVRLRYVQCPQSPFLNSDVQNVCSGK